MGLPIVHGCSATDAATIYENMKIGSTATGYWASVKAAFENNYACMGITCAEVGGIYASGSYKSGAEPFIDPSTPVSSSNNNNEHTAETNRLFTGVVVGVCIASGFAAIALIFSLWLFFRERQGKPVFLPIGPSMPKDYKGGAAERAAAVA